MIDVALEILRTELNEYLLQFTPSASQDIVQFEDLKDESTAPTQNVLGMTLISIEEERGHKAQDPYTRNDQGEVIKRNPDLRLNLYVMFSAFHGGSEGDYKQSLTNLSRAVTFFQGKKVFSTENTPVLSETNIDCLLLDINNSTTEQQNDLWGKFGTHYRPSVCYRVRMLTIQSNNVEETSPAIETLVPTLNQK